MDSLFITPYPPREVFKRKMTDKFQDILQEKTHTKSIDRVEYPESGGIFIYYLGWLHPSKGWTTPEALWSVNVVKKILIGYIKTVPLWSLPFINVQKSLTQLSIVSEKILDSYILDEKYEMLPAKETRKFLRNFWEYFRYNPWRVPEVLASIIQYDEAYCIRLQDLLSESSKEALIASPRKEVSRLISLWLKRENPVTRSKLYFVKYLPLLFFSRRIRKAFVNAVVKSKYENFVYTEADRYHALKRGDYDCFGESTDLREQRFIDLHFAAGVAPVEYKVRHGL